MFEDAADAVRPGDRMASMFARRLEFDRLAHPGIGPPVRSVADGPVETRGIRPPARRHGRVAAKVASS